MVSCSHAFTSRGKRVFFLADGIGEGVSATRLRGGKETGGLGVGLGAGGVAGAGFVVERLEELDAALDVAV
jgi:hypothetical protein